MSHKLFLRTRETPNRCNSSCYRFLEGQNDQSAKAQYKTVAVRSKTTGARTPIRITKQSKHAGDENSAEENVRMVKAHWFPSWQGLEEPENIGFGRFWDQKDMLSHFAPNQFRRNEQRIEAYALCCMGCCGYPCIFCRILKSWTCFGSFHSLGTLHS